MSDEAERAWEKWAAKHRSDIDVNWIAMTVKEAFLAGFEAGYEAGRDACPEPPFPED